MQFSSEFTSRCRNLLTRVAARLKRTDPDAADFLAHCDVVEGHKNREPASWVWPDLDYYQVSENVRPLEFLLCDYAEVSDETIEQRFEDWASHLVAGEVVVSRKQLHEDEW